MHFFKRGMHLCHFVMKPFKIIINNDVCKSAITLFQERWRPFFYKLWHVNTSMNLHQKQKQESLKVYSLLYYPITFHIVTIYTGQWLHCLLGFPPLYAFPPYLVTITNTHWFIYILFSQLGSAQTDCALFTQLHALTETFECQWLHRQ